MNFRKNTFIVALMLCLVFIAPNKRLMAEDQTSSQPNTQLQELTPLNNPNANTSKSSFFNPELIADVAQEISPSVVNIDVENVQEFRTDVQAFPFNNEFFQRFFGMAPQNPQMPRQKTFKKRSVGNGSGLIITPDGYVLTNNHVINDSEKIKVTLSNGQKYDAKVIGKDGFSDIAVLKIDASNLKPAKLGTSDNLRPGEWVIAIGSPLGYDHTVTFGIISAISRQVSNTNVNFIQTDAAINPGNSGGPLVNLYGEVIGINSAIAGIGTSIGFAIPINIVKDASKELIANGFIERPWIGIAMKPVDETTLKSLGLNQDTKGVVVLQISPDSPAAAAGLQPGDIIQRIDGEKISTADEVQKIVRNKKIKSELNLQILREGKLVAMPLTTGQWPGSLPPGEDAEPITP